MTHLTIASVEIKKPEAGGHLPIPGEKEMGSRLNSESHGPRAARLSLWLWWLARLCGFARFWRSASAAGKFSFRWNCQYIGLSE